MPKSRNRKDRELRRQISSRDYVLRFYQLQEQNESLRHALRKAQQDAYATNRMLVAVLAQNGEQRFTEGTLQQACDDDQTTFESKREDEGYVLRLVKTQTGVILEQVTRIDDGDEVLTAPVSERTPEQQTGQEVV